MEKYRLVQERKAGDSEDFLQSSTDIFPEVRITQQGKPRNYISYAMNLFVSQDAGLARAGVLTAVIRRTGRRRLS